MGGRLKISLSVLNAFLEPLCPTLVLWLSKLYTETTGNLSLKILTSTANVLSRCASMSELLYLQAFAFLQRSARHPSSQSQHKWRHLLTSFHGTCSCTSNLLSAIWECDFSWNIDPVHIHMYYLARLNNKDICPLCFTMWYVSRCCLTLIFFNFITLSLLSSGKY